MPKTTFVGEESLWIALYDETFVYHDGDMQRCDIFKELALKAEYHKKIWFSEIRYQQCRSSRKADKERKQIEKSREG